MFTITGMIVEIGETKLFESGFRTRHVIVDIGTSVNPNPVKVDCTDYAIEVLDDCNLNDLIEVVFTLKGRKWQGKYFTNISTTMVKQLNGSTPMESSYESTEWITNTNSNNKVVVDDDDDLPF